MITYYLKGRYYARLTIKGQTFHAVAGTREQVITFALMKAYKEGLIN